MQRYAKIEKKIGETPRAAIERFRKEADITPDTPLAYAGRLDPLARGVLIVLIGDECKQQQHYHALDKEYDFILLPSFSTDTGDVLGLARYAPTPSALLPERIQHTLASFTGTRTFPYPHFSSKTVGGKPLFLHALEGTIDRIKIPTTTSTIYSLSLLGTTTLTRDDLYADITRRIASIPPVTEARKAIGNDFRRPEIHARWSEVFGHIPEDALFPTFTLRAVVSSGTYIRSLAPALAEALGTTGLALDIHRTVVGRYHAASLPFLGALGWWQARL